MYANELKIICEHLLSSSILWYVNTCIIIIILGKIVNIYRLNYFNEKDTVLRLSIHTKREGN